MSSVQPPPTPEPQPYGPVTRGMVASLHATGPWLRFLSILGILAIGLILLAALFMLLMGGAMFGELERTPGMPPPALFGAIMAVVYVFVAMLYAAWTWLLHRQASAISRMKRAADVRAFTAAMEDAIGASRSFWRLSGIVIIVGIVLYFGVIAVFIAIGAMGAMGAAR
jgi:hypothetical protein